MKYYLQRWVTQGKEEWKKCQLAIWDTAQSWEVLKKVVCPACAYESLSTAASLVIVEFWETCGEKDYSQLGSSPHLEVGLMTYREKA